jgi:hypothetical protein
MRRQDAGANIRVADGPKGETRMRRVIQLLSFDVIPAQAGLSTAELVIHLDLALEVQSSTRPAGDDFAFLMELDPVSSAIHGLHGMTSS